MSKVYYWRGAVGEDVFLGGHQAAIDRLITGTYALADLERLKGHRDIFSYRLNQASRLLFTTIVVGGNRFLLLLEHLPKHGYETSRFLRAGVLNRYLEHHEEGMAAAAEEFYDVQEPPDALNGLARVDGAATALDHHREGFIQLSDLQQGVLHARLPVVISGVAGSGKSCVAMSLLSNDVYAHRHSQSALPRRLLYVTASPFLVESIKRDWLNLPVAQDLPAGMVVEFKHYDELLDELGLLHGKTLVDCAHFNAWYDDYVKKQRVIAKACGANTMVWLSSDEAYQEMRLCCAYLKEEYCKLGKRQSLLESDSEREAFYGIYQAYGLFLGQSNQIHAPFCELGRVDSYDLVAIDESQDFSLLQLSSLWKLARHRCAAFCMDSHQSLFDRHSKRPFLLEMMGCHGQEDVVHIELPVTYRCSSKVARAADSLIAAKYQVTGGLADKKEAPSIVPRTGDASLGHVFVLREDALSSWAWLNAQAKGAHFAVIAQPALMKDAQRFFPRARIFTPEEIKGLEYETVVVFRPFSSAWVKEAALLMTEGDEAFSARHRAKAGVGNHAFAPAFNQLITSFTRARQTLVIVDEETRESRCFLKPLMDIMGRELFSEAEHLKETTEREWEMEMMRLMDQGLVLRALGIYQSQLKRDKDGFDAFVAQQRQKDAPKPCFLVDNEPAAAVCLSAAEPAKPPVSIALGSAPSPRRKKKTQSSLPGPAPSSLEVRHINECLVDFTKKQLKGLLGQEMDFETYWIRTLVSFEGRHASLAEHMMLSVDRARLFANVLMKTPRLREKVKVIKMLEMLKSLDKACRLDKKAKTEILKALLICKGVIQNDKYVSKWLKGALCENGSDDVGGTLLYYLARDPSGLLLLNDLFKKRPDWLDAIPPMAWRLSSTASDSTLAGTFPLYFIMRMLEGHVMLQAILEVKADFLEGIPAEEWCSATDLNESFLHYLTEDTKGLQAILRKKPDFLDNIPVKAWSLAIAAGDNANMSPLYYLTATSGGRVILQTILTRKPDFFDGIPVEEWCRSPIAGAGVNTSSLYWLAAWPEGRAILQAMLSRKPDFFDDIPAKAWSLAPTAGGDANISPLYWLSAWPEGRVILQAILSRKPDYFDGIPMDVWCRAPIVGVKANTSILCWLAGGAGGCAILSAMLSRKPDFFDDIPAKAWSLAPTAGADANMSLLYCLTATSGGRTILQTILTRKPEFFDDIPVDVWCRARTASIDANASPLFWLAAGPQGHAILHAILSRKPDFFEGVPESSWRFPLVAGLYIDATAQQNTEHREFLQWLKSFLVHRPSLIHLIDTILSGTASAASLLSCEYGRMRCAGSLVSREGMFAPEKKAIPDEQPGFSGAVASHRESKEHVEIHKQTLPTGPQRQA